MQLSTVISRRSRRRFIPWNSPTAGEMARRNAQASQQTPRQRSHPERAETPPSGRGGSAARPILPRRRAWPDPRGEGAADKSPGLGGT